MGMEAEIRQMSVIEVGRKENGLMQGMSLLLARGVLSCVYAEELRRVIRSWV